MRERIIAALNSRDLTQNEYERAAHVIASLGAAQIGNRRHLNIGAMLLHVKAGHDRFIPRILILMSLTIVSKAKRDGWKGVGSHNADRIVHVALERFLDSNCGVCHGVGKTGRLGQVIAICTECRGSGHRLGTKADLILMSNSLGVSLRAMRNLDLFDRVKDVMALLDRYEGYASGATRRQAKEPDPS